MRARHDGLEHVHVRPHGARACVRARRDGLERMRVYVYVLICTRACVYAGHDGLERVCACAS